MNTLDKVRSRGYWYIRVKPQVYDANRAPKLAEVERAVRESAVSLRGWDFPQYDLREPPTRSTNYVEQAIDWEHYVELWRAYKSGQFIALKGVPDDWRDQSSSWPAGQDWQSGKTLSIEDAAFRIVEVYEFSARWSRAVRIQDTLVIECQIRGLQNRSLQVAPNRVPFSVPKTATSPEWKYSQVYEIPVLLGSARELAIPPTVDLFELFGWDVTPEVIRAIQGRLWGQG